jgi:hypothetical protein
VCVVSASIGSNSVNLSDITSKFRTVVTFVIADTQIILFRHVYDLFLYKFATVR